MSDDIHPSFMSMARGRHHIEGRQASKKEVIRALIADYKDKKNQSFPLSDTFPSVENISDRRSR